MTGYRPPLSWSKRIRDAHAGNQQTTFVLLDAASYLTSGRLDLKDVDAAPDFVAMSFYKIFGYPDLGALLVRKTAFEVMSHRRYFGGGTVEMVTVIDGTFHATKKHSLHDFLEDGTLPFHNIVALRHAIAIHKKIFGSAENISRHTAQLSAWLHERLRSFKHANDKPVIDIYKDENATFGDPKTQGPIIAFNALWSDGTLIGKSHFERLAIECGFQIRTGGVCNPGGIASMLQLNHWELRRNFVEGVRCGGDIDIIGAKPTGTLRVSLGPMSTMSDVVRFSEFIEHFLVETSISQMPKRGDMISSFGITPIEGCSAVTMTDIEPAAYKVWDRQWCIVDSESRRVVDSEITLQSLTISIDLQLEQLVIRHQDSGNELRLSLWSVPPEQATPEEHNGRSFDIYNDPQINEWVSSRLNFPCLLAQYRSEHLKKSPEMTTCVIRSCTMKCTDKNALKIHYGLHAQPFLQKHPFDSERRPSTFNTWRTTISKRDTSHSMHDTLSMSSQNPTAEAPAARSSRRSAKTIVASIVVGRISGDSSNSNFKTQKAHSSPPTTRLNQAKEKPKFKIISRIFGR